MTYYQKEDDLFTISPLNPFLSKIILGRIVSQIRSPFEIFQSLFCFIKFQVGIGPKQKRPGEHGIEFNRPVIVFKSVLNFTQ